MEKEIKQKNEISILFIMWGFFNIIGYVLPFVIYKGVITSWVSGYELFSWLNINYVGGPFIASISLIIYILCLLMIIYGVLTIVRKCSTKTKLHKTIILIFVFLFIIINGIGLLYFYEVINKIADNHIFAGFSTPVIGFGVVVVYSLNIVISILVALKIIIKDKAKLT